MKDYKARRMMMVDTQVRPCDVTKFPIIEAMLHVPREAFVPSALKEAAYVGENLLLGGGRTLLEARTFAKMLDALELQSGHVVMDLGCGFGYSTAVIARMVEFVVAVESDAAMAEEAQSNLSAQSVDNAAVMQGDLAAGAEKSGPYDAIILQGAAEIVPDAVLAQLREGGKMACIFAEGALGVVRIGHKIDGTVNWRFSFNAAAPVVAGFEKRASFAL